MAPEPVNQWSVDDVATWLCAIGLGSKVDAFKENAVDGALLSTLSKDDLTNDLGLSGIQAKKVMLELEFVEGLTSGGGGGGGADPAQVQQLQAELQQKNAKIAELEKELAALKPAPAPTYTTKTTYHSAPRPQPHVIRGAAGGAAKGAVTGAVVGAIRGDAAQGAKAGAAGGATLGAMNGVGQRRRARRRGMY